MTTPAELAQELTTVLAAEADVLAQLRPALENERRALIDADIASLIALTHRKESLVLRLTTLETARRNLIATLASTLAVDPARLDLGTVLRLIPNPPVRLARLRHDLRAMLPGLLAANTGNGALLQQSLGFLQRLLTRLLAGLVPGSIYASSGRTSGSVGGVRLVDRQA